MHTRFLASIVALLSTLGGVAHAQTDAGAQTKERQEARLQQVRRDATIENAVRQSQQPNPQLFWWETLNARNSRAWLVVDPPDGKVPPQTTEGQQRATARAEARRQIKGGGGLL
jgi:Ni/Co efflux regulator RcnB